MEDATVLAIATLIVAAVLQLGTSIVTMFQNRALAALATTANDKADLLVQKTNQIGATTDGHLSKVTEDLAKSQERDTTAQGQIVGLQDQVKGMQELMTKLIAAEKQNGRGPDVPAPATHVPAIEAHTEETADNTKKTDTAVVQALKKKKR